MTNAEAKEIIKRIKGYMGNGECWSEAEFMAMDKAIEALSSWEKYSDRLWKKAYERGKADVIGYKLADEVNTIIENQEEMDRIRTAHLFGTVGGCYTSNSTDNKEK